jgi:Fic family protein
MTNDYIHISRFFQCSEWENWPLYYFKGVSSQSQAAITCIERLGRLRISFRERLGRLRISFREHLRSERAINRLMQTLDVLFERPILNICQLEAAFSVSYRTVQRYVVMLKEIGILKEVTGQACNLIYHTNERLRALESS